VKREVLIYTWLKQFSVIIVNDRYCIMYLISIVSVDSELLELQIKGNYLLCCNIVISCDTVLCSC